jgi:hypothetical protein
MERRGQLAQHPLQPDHGERDVAEAACVVFPTGSQQQSRRSQQVDEERVRQDAATAQHIEKRGGSGGVVGQNQVGEPRDVVSGNKIGLGQHRMAGAPAREQKPRYNVGFDAVGEAVRPRQPAARAGPHVAGLGHAHPAPGELALVQWPQ